MSEDSTKRLKRIWKNMHTRCYNTRNPKYSNYGGRGINMCEDWKRFRSFMAWAVENGYDDKLTIDRKNNNGNYEPNNCRWSTQKEQQNNRRDCVFVTCDGITRTISQWGDALGIDPKLIRRRLVDYGFSPEKAFTKGDLRNGRTYIRSVGTIAAE